MLESGRLLAVLLAVLLLLPVLLLLAVLLLLPVLLLLAVLLAVVLLLPKATLLAVLLLPKATLLEVLLVGHGLLPQWRRQGLDDRAQRAELPNVDADRPADFSSEHSGFDARQEVV